MSTALLYHAWGTRGYSHVRTRYEGGTVVFAMQQNSADFCCAHCGSRQVVRSGLLPRRFRSLPIGRRPVFLELPIQRLWCAGCSKTRQAAVRFADPRRTYTHSFERYVLDLSGHMTIKDVAVHLGVGWDVVKDIQKRHLQAHYAKPKLKHVEYLAIDEISIGKGHRYLTVVLDLESGAVVFVGPGKGTDALVPFWKRLQAAHAHIRAVATDMSLAYTCQVSAKPAHFVFA